MIRADNNYYYLFRADSGLPMGIPPVSPAVRRQLWQGKTFDQAIDLVDEMARNLWIDDTDASLTSHLGAFSNVNYQNNPLVSTTTDFRTAYSYATQSYNQKNAYISILRLELTRFVYYGDYIDFGIAVDNKECGVISLIAPEEIISQIPLNTILNEIPIKHLKSRTVFEKYKNFLLDKIFAFKPKSLFSLHCPKCHQQLYTYLNECIGNLQHQLALYDPEEFVQDNIQKRTIFRKGNILHNLARQGKIVICENCGVGIYNHATANQVPLKLVRFQIKDRKLLLELKNETTDYVDTITIEIRYLKNGELCHKRFQISMVEWYPFNPKYFERSGIGPKLLRKISQKLLQPLNKPISPNSSVLHKVDLESDMDFEGIKITWVHFRSGKTWIPLDDFDEITNSC